MILKRQGNFRVFLPQNNKLAEKVEEIQHRLNLSLIENSDSSTGDGHLS